MDAFCCDCAAGALMQVELWAPLIVAAVLSKALDMHIFG
jgi:hypothetical protein